MKKTTTAVVDAIGELHVEGNIIPQQWFKAITLPNGKPDMNAVVILAEIRYWYTPTIVRDEQTGEIVEVRKKFRSDKWQCNYEPLSIRFGLTARQAEDAVTRLKKRGLVTLSTSVMTLKSGLKVGKALYIEPVPAALRKITSLAHISRSPKHDKTYLGKPSIKESGKANENTGKPEVRSSVPAGTTKRASIGVKSYRHGTTKRTYTTNPTKIPTAYPTKIPTTAPRVSAEGGRASKNLDVVVAEMSKPAQMMYSLLGIGLHEAIELAKLPHVTEPYMRDWLAFSDRNVEEHIASKQDDGSFKIQLLGAGYYVKHIRNGDVSPILQKWAEQQKRDTAHAGDPNWKHQDWRKTVRKSRKGSVGEFLEKHQDMIIR